MDAPRNYTRVLTLVTHLRSNLPPTESPTLPRPVVGRKRKRSYSLDESSSHLQAISVKVFSLRPPTHRNERTGSQSATAIDRSLPTGNVDRGFSSKPPLSHGSLPLSAQPRAPPKVWENQVYGMDDSSVPVIKVIAAEDSEEPRRKSSKLYGPERGIYDGPNPPPLEEGSPKMDLSAHNEDGIMCKAEMCHDDTLDEDQIEIAEEISNTVLECLRDPYLTKMRTGELITTWLLHEGRFETSEWDALNDFVEKEWSSEEEEEEEKEEEEAEMANGEDAS